MPFLSSVLGLDSKQTNKKASMGPLHLGILHMSQREEASYTLKFVPIQIHSAHFIINQKQKTNNRYR